MFKDKKLVKNYIILFCIFVLVFLFMLYVSKWHHVYNDYKLEIPVIRGTLNYEITAEEFDHVIFENPDTVVYMCTSSSDSCRSFEKDFKKVIEKLNLQDKIIYLNLSNADIERFVEEFNSKYSYKIKLTENYPALVEFSDGKVTGLIEGSDDEVLSIAKVNNFITINHIGEEE